MECKGLLPYSQKHATWPTLFLKIYFNIILPSMPWYPKFSSLQIFWPKTCTVTCLLLCGLNNCNTNTDHNCRVCMLQYVWYRLLHLRLIIQCFTKHPCNKDGMKGAVSVEFIVSSWPIISNPDFNTNTHSYRKLEYSVYFIQQSIVCTHVKLYCCNVTKLLTLLIYEH
jgi:hypothetical protein